MASNMRDFIKGSRTKHAVGTVTDFPSIRTFTNGATVTEDGGVDNYCLVEMNYVDGVPTIKYATALAAAENVFLTVTPESVFEEYNEKLCDFYNAKGDLATIAYLPAGFKFETSNVDEVTSAQVGNYVIWDAAKKAFAVKATPETADIKVFQIQSIESDERYSIDEMTLVELVVIR